MPTPAQLGGLYAYCLTVPCSRVLDDLARSGLDAEVVDVTAAALAIATTAIAFALIPMLAPRSHCARTLIGASSLVCSLFIADALPAAVDQRRKMEPAAPWLQLHSCFDYERCAAGFSVYVDGHNRSTLNHAARTQKAPKVWLPPEDVDIARSPGEACIVLSLNALGDSTLPQIAKPACTRGACGIAASQGGRNRVVVDMSDPGISSDGRMRHLGCSMLAQTHSELTNHIPGFDIALPLGLVPGRNGAPDAQKLEAVSPWPSSSLLHIQHSAHGAAADMPVPRRYWLTFRGSINYGRYNERRALMLPLARNSTPARPIVIAAYCSKSADGNFAESHDISSDRCHELERDRRGAPSYLSTLNTTFALVPGGMQPASFRLDEVCAAGAIPVFISGDLASSSAYVRPFDDVIRWNDISLHFAWEHTHRIVDALTRISPAEVARMQRGVHQAWHRYLRPPQAHRRTLYTLLEQRASYRYRRRLRT